MTCGEGGGGGGGGGEGAREAYGGDAEDVGVGGWAGVDNHWHLALHVEDETGNTCMVCLNRKDAGSSAQVGLVGDQGSSTCKRWTNSFQLAIA